MSQSQDYQFINAFNIIPGIGPKKLYTLSHHFDSFADAWHADEKSLCAAGFAPELVENITLHQSTIDPQKEWKKCTDEKISLLTAHDDAFPHKLRDISSPPFCLYVRGNINELNTPSVAIVGSRKITAYGIHATRTLAADIARSGISIVSGLALGTDSIAHKVALDHQGTTIAVLGGGIDNATITPRSHIGLAHEIIKNNGILISEYPTGTAPSRGTFPARNRIMAGITDATIIIEAAHGSGTLITADYAHKYKRTLFALPGSIFSDNSLGPNMLIKDGIAQPILSSADIIKLFHKKQPAKKNKISLDDKDQEKIYKVIAQNHDGIQINKIIKETSLDTRTVSGAITLMEIDGAIKNIGNQTYIIQK